VSAAHLVAELYTDHHRWLHTWLRRKLGCNHRAADLAHDTFLRLLRRPAMVDPAQPRALLTHIAKALVIDHWRRQEIERAFVEALAVLPAPEAPSPEVRLLALEALFRIDAMLRKLPSRTREIFLLAQFDGLSYPKIGEILGLSVPTIKRHMHAGFVACLTALED
jgi:RNA polymerase sigma-19 factor, ECF subfamily